jgi:hypothetical protein
MHSTCQLPLTISSALAKYIASGYKLQFPIDKLDINVITPNGCKILYRRNIGDVYALRNISPILPSTHLR